MNLIKGFKDKINVVSEDFSNSILSKSKQKQTETQDSIDLQSVGAAEILKNYQQAWADIHHENYKISKLAEQADKRLDHIFLSATNQYDIFCKLHHEVSGINSLSSDIDITLQRIDNLTESCIVLEELLCILENKIEEGELLKNKCLKTQELQNHRRRSLQVLETKKVQLAQNHAKKMADFESKRQKTLLERQATFEEEFQRDLNQYRTSGKFERAMSSSSAVGATSSDQTATSDMFVDSGELSEDRVLASLQPDIDEKTCAELDSFLQDSPTVEEHETCEQDSSSDSGASPGASSRDSPSHQ